MSLIRGIRAGYPSGVIRAEGSERKDSSVGNRAEGSERMEYGSKQRNPSEKIREEGYERKSSEWKDLCGGI